MTVRFCYHPNASVVDTGAWLKRKCPDCPAWSACTYGQEPMALVPWALADRASTDEETP
jgi:hypothetical protein